MSIFWTTEQAKQEEWAKAKEALAPNGMLLPNGTKFRRKDSHLEHSFIVLNETILATNGQNEYLGKCVGSGGKVKLAENESGELYVLKIIPHPGEDSEVIRDETDIASDLGKAFPSASRTFTSKDSHNTHKHYIPYLYLGKPLDKLLVDSLSEDRRFELGIKIVLALEALHSGRGSKKGYQYAHADIHSGNIVIDTKNDEIHIIDFGRSRHLPTHSLLRQIHDYFFTPRKVTDLERKKLDCSLLSRTLGYESGAKETSVFTEEMFENNTLNVLFMNYSIKKMIAESRDKSYFMPLKEFAKRLTLIRFKLENSTLYNKTLTPLKTKLIVDTLNQNSQKIQTMYRVIDGLKFSFKQLGFGLVSAFEVSNLQNTFQRFLLAYAEHNQNGMAQYVNEFETICRSLCEHPLLRKQEEKLELALATFNQLEFFPRDDAIRNGINALKDKGINESDDNETKSEIIRKI